MLLGSGSHEAAAGQHDVDRQEVVDGEPVAPGQVAQWGDEWVVGAGKAPIAMVHATCGERTTAVLACDHCGEELRGRDVRVVAGPGLDDPAMVPARRKAATT